MSTKKEPKKKINRIAAGEVLLMEYTGEDRPCNKSMSLLLAPLKWIEGESIGAMKMAYAIDIEKEEYLPDYMPSVYASVKPIKDKKLKAWYFGLIIKLNEQAKQEGSQK